MDDIADKVQNATEEIDAEAAIDRLAKLSPVDYDRVRVQEKNRLGIQQKTLDSQVEKRRKADGGNDNPDRQGRAIELPEPEPWPEPVDGIAGADDISRCTSRYLFAPSPAHDVIAVWALAAHTYTAFRLPPSRSGTK